MAPRSTHAEPPIPTILRQMAVVSTLYEELLYSFQVCIHYRRTKTKFSHMSFRMALQLERWVLHQWPIVPPQQQTSMVLSKDAASFGRAVEVYQ